MGLQTCTIQIDMLVRSISLIKWIFVGENIVKRFMFTMKKHIVSATDGNESTPVAI